jgi:hypothetical protein
MNDTGTEPVSATADRGGDAPAIRTNGLTKRYGADVLAVDDLDLVVEQGEVFGFPGFSRRVADTAVEGPARAGAVGLLLVVGIPVLLVLTALTIIGIPLTVLGAMLFGILAWVGTVYGRIAVGTWLTAYTAVESRWIALLVGFVVVGVAVRIPFVGWIPEFFVGLLGLGALALALTEHRRRVRRTTPEQAPGTDAGVSAA